MKLHNSEYTVEIRMQDEDGTYKYKEVSSDLVYKIVDAWGNIRYVPIDFHTSETLPTEFKTIRDETVGFLVPRRTNG